MGAAGYFYLPELFETSGTVNPDQQVAVPVPDEVKSIAIDTNANATAMANANTSTDVPADVAANSTVTSPANSATKTTEQAKATRGTGTNAPEPRDSNKIVVDGDTIYMGNTKITDDKVETPDSIIDDNGVTPKVPTPPRTRNPRMIQAPDLSHLTPEQRKRVIRTLRRNGVIIVRPTPTPSAT